MERVDSQEVTPAVVATTDLGGSLPSSPEYSAAGADASFAMRGGAGIRAARPSLGQVIRRAELTVGPANDPLEAEADAAAARVVRRLGASDVESDERTHVDPHDEDAPRTPDEGPRGRIRRSTAAIPALNAVAAPRIQPARGRATETVRRVHQAVMNGKRSRAIAQLGEAQLEALLDDEPTIRKTQPAADGTITLTDGSIAVLPDAALNGLDGLFAAAGERLDMLRKKTKSFNVRGRALDPVPGACLLITDSAAFAKIAYKNKVNVVSFAQWRADDEPGQIVRTFVEDSGLKLVGDRDEYLYYGYQGGTREPRKDASMKTGDTLPTGSHNGSYVTPEHVLTRSAERGDESKARDAAMGGFTARNYATEAGAPQKEVEATPWEWLHLIASSLGGANAEGNLVAGTYDGNTRMIPWEQAILQWSQEIVEKDPKTHITMQVKCQTYGDTWLGLTVQITAKNGLGKSIASPVIDVYKGTTMDKMEYDAESYLADQMVSDALSG